jgi:hypothetical protein
MKVRSLLLVFLFSLLLSNGLFAQNIYPEKIDVLVLPKFCMDCGAPKANCDSFVLGNICDRINRRYNFAKGAGNISFQVLVKSTGISCVLSHSDVTHSPLTAELVIALNTCIWTPAQQEGIPVNSSVNVMFTIGNGKITAQMERMDLTDLGAPGNATVYNKDYKYNNQSINKYNLTVFTRYNSPLPDNRSLAALVDKSDILWYGSSQGLTRFDGQKFNPVNETNSPLTGTTAVHTIALDKENNKWMYANKAVYMASDSGWRVFDSVHLGIPRPYRIVTTHTGEIFFPNSKGLLIVRNGKVRLIDKSVVFQLPSNNVYYAYYDSKERLWIGTARGSIMIDKKQNVTDFNGLKTPLNNMCITNIQEDEHGNMYFSLYAAKKAPADDIEEEGIAVMSSGGHWEHYNDKNSGMPANHVNAILYDKFEHCLWVGTRLAGLVRFDLKEGWENYHNNNSTLPGYDISQIVQDSKGVLYVSTANGLVMFTKK